MKKLIISTVCLLSMTMVAYAQVRRDTGGDSGSGIDITSVGIGVIIGLIIGYLVGSRTKKA